MKRIIALITFLCMIMISSSCAFAAEQADSIIAFADVSLNKSGVATFSVTIYEEASSIRVSRCKLQRYENREWVDVGSLPAPSTVIYNTIVYATTKNYSSYIPSGDTYRIMVTFDIDGYTKSYPTNEVSY